MEVRETEALDLHPTTELARFLPILRCLSALVLLFSFLLPRNGFGIDICAFHAFTGIPCPGCGLTRAFCAISRGGFSQAWALHPFSFPIYGATLACLATPTLVRHFPVWNASKAQRILVVLGLLFGAAFLLFGLARMARYCPWP